MAFAIKASDQRKGGISASICALRILASNGYLVTNKQENSFNSKIEEFIAVNGPDTFYAQGFKSGDRVKNLALANTLKRIAKYGKSGFYEGPNADNLVERVKETGGIITHDDLLAYSPV